MKVKAAEIARQLGLSKATVSLALNNKPGVSHKTKKMILEYIDKMEYGLEESYEGKTIRILLYSMRMHISYNDFVDLWDEVIREFSNEAKKDGFSVVVDYIDGSHKESVYKSIEECKDKQVSGIILMGHEMTVSDYEPFRSIQKPMIIYDNDFNDNHSCIVIDNQDGVKKCINYYLKKGIDEICYLGNDDYSYNFLRRRDAYLYMRTKYGFKGDIHMVGKSVDDICENVKKLYSNNCRAFICENYTVSIGTIKAFKELGQKIGEDVLVIGIDQIPDYYSYGYQLTTIRITHAQRAFLAMELLKKEITNQKIDRFKIYSTCTFIKGDTA
ncbi:MAG: LacI family DNA-binding transcriptional regulator [Faecalibacillus sp.]